MDRLWRVGGFFALAVFFGWSSVDVLLEWVRWRIVEVLFFVVSIFAVFLLFLDLVLLLVWALGEELFPLIEHVWFLAEQNAGFLG